jgi:hypothetical protein
MRHLAARGTRATALVLTTITTVFSLSCDKKSPTSPSSNLQVTSVSPGSGSTLGGTSVTISGSNFAAGATVSFGGAAASSVTVVSDTTLTAVTPQHASGAADVVVSASGKSGTLRSGYTFQAPGRQDNQSPTIANISVKGTGRNEPGGFADLDEQVNVAATVSDPETSVNDLTLEWSSEVGTINGSGPNVTWTAPHDAPTPHDYGITLTVTEKYQTTDDNGLPVTKENKTTRTVTVSLHNSRKEVGDMAYQFLTDFSQSGVSKSTVLQNFASSCQGTTDEGGDVDKNRTLWNIDTYRIGSPDVTIKFGGTCPFRSRGGVDACAQVYSEWHSTCRRTGKKANTHGIDQVTAIYQGNRWWLCGSDYDLQEGDGPSDEECAGHPLGGRASPLSGPGTTTTTTRYPTTH